VSSASFLETENSTSISIVGQCFSTYFLRVRVGKPPSVQTGAARRFGHPGLSGPNLSEHVANPLRVRDASSSRKICHQLLAFLEGIRSADEWNGGRPQAAVVEFHKDIAGQNQPAHELVFQPKRSIQDVVVHTGPNTDVRV
jgi:hypothetical protein